MTSSEISEAMHTTTEQCCEVPGITTGM